MKQISVPLPSKGLLYPKDSPLYKKEEVLIREMTAQEEDILASRDLWKNGKFIDELLKACVVEKEVKSNLSELLVGDRNVLIVSIRVYSLGHEYDTIYTCPVCGTKSKHTFDLSKIKATGICVPNKDEEVDLNSLQNQFTLTLPKSGSVITFKLLTSSESRDIDTTNDRIKEISNSKVDQLVTLRMKKMITSVDGKTDKAFISEFINEMGAFDSSAFRKYANKISPDIQIEELVICGNCDHKEVVDMPKLDANFFWID